MKAWARKPSLVHRQDPVDAPIGGETVDAAPSARPSSVRAVRKSRRGCSALCGLGGHRLAGKARRSFGPNAIHPVNSTRQERKVYAKHTAGTTQVADGHPILPIFPKQAFETAAVTPSPLPNRHKRKSPLKP